MTPAEIAKQLLARFPDAGLIPMLGDKHPRAHLEATHWLDVAAFLHDEATLQFDWLANLSGIDYPADEKMAVVYDLWSFELRHRFAVKVFTRRTEPLIPSVQHIWRAANWHEREAYDMFGIDFSG
ncbi:MAG: NADH-quinone oxidoreductase subunit C, partial [Phycisphaerae bacterium]|nr:NADH-quinone oxidoreductase subunit C [Phycisphaerae bacterium]